MGLVLSNKLARTQPTKFKQQLAIKDWKVTANAIIPKEQMGFWKGTIHPQRTEKFVTDNNIIIQESEDLQWSVFQFRASMKEYSLTMSGNKP